MSFISYAQNFEDVMLWRALKHIEKGFYIDVGANDPDTDSVTRAFYEKGWRGINIDPIPQWFQRLQKNRIRDINLQLAAGSEPGEITLYEIPDTGLSTAKETFAERHKEERGFQCQALKVPQDTLTNLCEQYHIAPIHFLKIDVEGMERAVLEGIDFLKIRPWIVLVESTLPNTQDECYEEWEVILTGAGYQYAYSDGLNRFYVADEHSELLSAFQYPPNFFDEFVLKKQLDTENRASDAVRCAEEAEKKGQDIQASNEKLQQDIEAERQKTEQLQQDIEAERQRTEQLQQDIKAERRETEKLLEQAKIKVEQLECELSEKKLELATTQSMLEQEQDRNQGLHNEWDAAQANNSELNASSHHWWSVADDLNRKLGLIYQSKSWRLTWPLRKLMQAGKWLFHFQPVIFLALKKVSRWLLAHTMAYILRHDQLKYCARRYLHRHPALEARLRIFAYARGVIPGSMVSHQSHYVDPSQNGKEEVSVADDMGLLSSLTPRARLFYTEITSAIEKRYGGTS